MNLKYVISKRCSRSIIAILDAQHPLIVIPSQIESILGDSTSSTFSRTKSQLWSLSSPRHVSMHTKPAFTSRTKQWSAGFLRVQHLQTQRPDMPTTFETKDLSWTNHYAFSSSLEILIYVAFTTIKICRCPRFKTAGFWNLHILPPLRQRNTL